MMDFLRFSGAALALIAALVFSREYEKFLAARLSLSEGFLELVRSIRYRIDCFLSPADELLLGFENLPLEESGYLDEANKVGVAKAYFENEDKLALPEEVKKLLSSFFREFGKDYREGTLRLADGVIADLERRICIMRDDKEKSVKLVRTLSVAAALGLVILLV